MGNIPLLGCSIPVALMLLTGCGAGSGTTPPPVSAATQAPSASTQAIVLDAIAASPTKVDMSWAGSSARGARYRIYRDGKLVSTVHDGDGKAYDAGLTPGSRYCYQ